jgi:hypothetical protein
MMMNTHETDWTAIHQGLIAPFTPDEVEWKPAGKGGANTRTTLVCYIDARAVAQRLDSVVGCEGWAFTFTPIVVENGEVKVGKGSLAIHGIVKEDVGEWSAWSPSKGCASDALKRAASLWGIARYLYSLGDVYCVLDANGRIPASMLATLRERLAARFAA